MKQSECHDVMIKDHESVDEFMNGRLKLIQSRSGYRFSIDAVLLSDFVTLNPGDVVIDLGSGCGIIPLILLLKKKLKHAYALEIQWELAHQTLRNSVLNCFENKMSVVMGDIRSIPIAQRCADAVICNPPYRRKGSGRINPDNQRAIARHEILASLDDIVKAAKWLLKPGGRLSIIYPAERLNDLMIKLRAADLEPKRLRIIYPGQDNNAKLVMVEGCPGGRPGLKILPPLISQGEYSIARRT